MSFCKYSSEYIESSTTEIDNSFITDFLPNAPEHTITIYLYGLYICKSNKDINIEDFAHALHLEVEDIKSAFTYWEELGLVQVLSTEPMEVRYLPTSKGSFRYKKYNKDTYKNFNSLTEEILAGRTVNPNEFNEYYYLIETYHLEKDALISIMEYCVGLKDNKVGYPYIVAVAKSFINDGLLTEKQVNDRIAEQTMHQSEVTDVLRALKIKSRASADDYNLYITWTKELGFDLSAIISLCKRVKKGGMSRLDSLITKCFEQKLYDVKEIESYFDNLDQYYAIAKKVTKNIGVRYDNLEVVVENYISRWISLGFSEDTLAEISNYCFLKNIKTLGGLDEIIEKFYALGLLDLTSIHDHIDRLNNIDRKIKDILSSVSLTRAVTELDRKYYNTWTNEWNINTELLDYAISLAQDKNQPMIYLNRVLSTYHAGNISTVEQAKNITVDYSLSKTDTTKKTKKTITSRSYEGKDLNALFADVKKVEL